MIKLTLEIHTNEEGTIKLYQDIEAEGHTAAETLVFAVRSKGMMMREVDKFLESIIIASDEVDNPS